LYENNFINLIALMLITCFVQRVQINSVILHTVEAEFLSQAFLCLPFQAVTVVTVPL